MHALSSFSFYIVQGPKPGSGTAHFKLGLPTAIRGIKTIPHRHATTHSSLSLFSQVIVDHTKMTKLISIGSLNVPEGNTEKS